MRKFPSALVLLIALTACESSTEPSGGSPLFSESELHEDAAALALREMARTDSLALLPVTIDPLLIDAFYQALLAVRATIHPAADSVTRLYPIRARGETRQFFVVADTAADHFDPWREGDRITEVPGLDSLTLKYGIQLQHYTPLHGIGWDMFLLGAPVPVNLDALGRRYSFAPGVRYAEPNHMAGGGNDIEAEREGGAWLLTYSVGWGDCPAGCIHRHYWRFRVDGAGNVAYLGSGGDPAPSPEEWPSMR